ncbi:MAG: hypothetical protein RIA71_00275 [Oceanicaulis sp.]
MQIGFSALQMPWIEAPLAAITCVRKLYEARSAQGPNLIDQSAF